MCARSAVSGPPPRIMPKHLTRPLTLSPARPLTCSTGWRCGQALPVSRPERPGPHARASHGDCGWPIVRAFLIRYEAGGTRSRPSGSFRYPGARPTTPGMPVLPDNAIARRADHDNPVVEVVVDDDVAVGHGEGQRGLVEAAEAPWQPSGGRELHGLSGIGVVRGQVV